MNHAETMITIDLTTADLNQTAGNGKAPLSLYVAFFTGVLLTFGVPTLDCRVRPMLILGCCHVVPTRQISW